MRVDKINTINTNNENNKIGFKKMMISKPEYWPAKVLDTFVKNKDVQELTRDWACENKDLIACCIGGLLDRYVLTINKNSKLMHTLEADSLEDMQKCVAEFRKSDIITVQMSEKEKDRLDNINNYIDEFNKSLEAALAEKANSKVFEPKPEEKAAKTITLLESEKPAAKNSFSQQPEEKPVKKSFWQRLFNK